MTTPDNPGRCVHYRYYPATWGHAGGSPEESECIHLRHSDLLDASDSCEWEGELPVGGECGEGCPGWEERWEVGEDE